MTNNANAQKALGAMKLAELQALASSMGIKSISRMRKADLIAAIGGSSQAAPATAAKAKAEPAAKPAAPKSAAAKAHDGTAKSGEPAGGKKDVRTAQAINQLKAELAVKAELASGTLQRRANQAAGPPVSLGEAKEAGARQGEFRHRDDESSQGQKRRRGRERYRDRKTRPKPNGGHNGSGQGGGGGTRDAGPAEEIEVREDDVLVPVAGILDVLDNYAFVRTSGYLPGPGDVYVSLSQVRRVGLREGDAIVGAVRQPREGEGAPRQKYNALVRIDSVNGKAPSEAAKRPEFAKLTPLYPQERLRLETDPENLTTRVIDLVAPIGKGQRGLIVSPAKAGKTMIMQAIANAVTANNPEVHLMVVLVDERPEEVTDFERSVKGEVISSTFDRPAADHTVVAELAIERAKRLVEMGHDVLILLDGITRLGRAYNLAAPASGRILSGGVDSSALYPPKKFFGAARNIEGGGSLTILATALIESGSKMDEVIFEEFKGTGNMELRLSRSLADKRLYPAVDVDASGTRREEYLMTSDELKINWKLRRVLSALDIQQAIELLTDRLRKTSSNAEFMLQVNKTTPDQM